MGGLATLFVFDVSAHVCIGVYLGPSAQPIPPVFFIVLSVRKRPPCMSVQCARSFIMETVQFGVGLAHYSSQVERPMSGFEVVTVVRRLAKKEHSAALAQLVSRTSAIMKFGAGVGVDPFVRVKGLITDLSNRLQAEASSEASHKAYCDEQTSKATEISRPMLGSNLPNWKRPWPDPPFWMALDKAQTELDDARHGFPTVRTATRCTCSLLRTADTGQRGPGEGKSGLVSSRESRYLGGGGCLALWRRHWSQA